MKDNIKEKNKYNSNKNDKSLARFDQKKLKRQN